MKKNNSKVPILGLENSILDELRQRLFYPEFRIAPPQLPSDTPEAVATNSQPAPVVPTPMQSPVERDALLSNQLVTEFATCLWYLKTKHFKQEWDAIESKDDDPRVRRALSRLNKSIELLAENGIEIDDPINKRYPQGGEGMMRPIQFLPTAGLTFEVVTETVAPIVYRDDRLIQRGEVFVAVPKEKATAVARETATTTPIELGPANTLAESKAASGEGNPAIDGIEVANDASKDSKPQAALTTDNNSQGSDTPAESIRSTAEAEAEATSLTELDDNVSTNNCGQGSTDRDN
jgi:hypothetical protein